MAKVTWQDPVASIKGKLGEKSQIIFRQKTIRAESGHILKVLPQEAFIVEHPRNWDKHPASDPEKQRLNRWRKASQQATTLLADAEKKALRRKRLEAQLQHPDPQAPISQARKAQKSYTKFDCCIRAIIFQTTM